MTVDVADWSTPDAAPEPGLEKLGRRARVAGDVPLPIFADAERGSARWRTCRSIWTRMAETTTDTTPATVPVTADELEDVAAAEEVGGA